MENKKKVIQELFARLDELTRQQKVFQDEIKKIQADIYELEKSESRPNTIAEILRSPGTTPETKAAQFVASQNITPSYKSIGAQDRKKAQTPWEEFIGENLLNKVGIAVLVLGIGFGAKYSIDHELIAPLTRIILGYLAGLTLIGIAFRLKPSHPGFSAVLLSGGMAVLYFITYIAYSFYDELIPQVPAFVMMVLFTVCTVFAAVRYNQEVIGIIGLVGAYAVPLLLSDGSSRVVILFTYISIINSGILVLSFKKYWKGLYYLAFILTWLAFGSWYAFSFDGDTQTSTSLIFSTIFFVTFYTTFLAYKLIRNESLDKGDVICMLLNSFIYFGYGYLTVESLENGSQYLGLFTVLNALMHFVACVIIYKKQDSFNDIFYFVAGMVLVFLTIAVPVQLEGSWVTLVWAGEAALLFWIGRSKSYPTYEKICYSLIGLAFLSLSHDWSIHYVTFFYDGYEQQAGDRIFLNVHFLTSMLVGAAFIFILRVSKRHANTDVYRNVSAMHKLFTIGVPVLTVIVFYGGFFKEIEAFWNNQYSASRMVVQGSDGIEYNHDLLHFKSIWLIIYSSIFATLLCLVQVKLRTHLSGFACLAINSVVLFTFITAGLLDLSALRSSFLDQDLAAYYQRGYVHIIIRYAAILTIFPLLWYNGKLARQEFFKDNTRKAENLGFHFVVLVLLSSELIHWLDMMRVENSFKLSLSILWGAYALFLIVVGLSRDLKHMRLGAIVLFAATLLKLFIYDMSDMGTILKTVVTIILGTLLLTASFIYNKYKRAAGNEAR
ncbi:MAG: DUF2339 domain-containing protein [Cyclobacteriaceae bacterium]